MATKSRKRSSSDQRQQHRRGTLDQPVACRVFSGSNGRPATEHQTRSPHEQCVRRIFCLRSILYVPSGAGTDEQIEAKLRQMVPAVRGAPIRYVSHLPTHSALEGRRTGQTVFFLKTYQGTSFGGYKVGDQLVGIQKDGHAVHYEGQLSPDGLVIEGRWWIDADPAYATRRTESTFLLRRWERTHDFLQGTNVAIGASVTLIARGRIHSVPLSSPRDRNAGIPGPTRDVQVAGSLSRLNSAPPPERKPRLS
jgi:hypothetical protein